MSEGGSGRSGVIIAAIITSLATIVAAWIALSGNGDGSGPTGGGGGPKPDYSDRAGFYTGQGANETANTTFPASLNLRSIQSSGHVDAYVQFSEGSGGYGNLTGTVGEDARMTLSGEFYTCQDAGCTQQWIWDSNFDCEFTDQEAIKCTWNIDPRQGNPLGSQDGTLSVIKS
jgi:hypothetical protein